MKIENMNDIDMKNWKKYREEDIRTDSLWIIGRRDNSGVHSPDYWGNFIPQIPHQMMIRYTKKGETVLDPFLGLGTTLIEGKRLGRNGIGIELNPKIANMARKKIEEQTQLIYFDKENKKVKTLVLTGDSRTISIPKETGQKNVQLIIMHPPYWDIINFSKDKNNLCNASTLNDFLKMFREVVDNVTPLLDDGRFLALVIGDKYAKGEWIPLGFLTMNEVIKAGYILKSIIVKNMSGNERGKGIANNLWRYRALKGGFCVFKHEYVMVFQKKMGGFKKEFLYFQA